MSYLLLKCLHILRSTLLFGTGFGTAFHSFLLSGRKIRAWLAAVGRSVVLADGLFTAPAVVIQPVTGITMALLAGVPLMHGWLALVVLSLSATLVHAWLASIHRRSRDFLSNSQRSYLSDRQTGDPDRLEQVSNF